MHFCSVKYLLPLLLLIAFQAPAQDYRALRKDADETFTAKKYEEAVGKYRHAMDYSSNGWEDNHCILRIAASLRALRRFDEAIEWYNTIQDLPDLNQNNRVRYIEYIGDVYYQTKDYPKATEFFLKCFDEAVDARHRANLLEKLGRLSRQAGKKDEAVRYYQSAMTHPEPNYWAVVSSRYQLADMYMADKKYTEIFDLYKDQDITKYARHEIRNAANQTGLAAYRSGNYQLAIEYFSKSPEEDYLKLIHLGRSNQALKNYRQARSYYIRISDNKKINANQRAEALMLSGDTYRAEKKLPDAEKDYKAARKTASDKNMQKQLDARLESLKPKPKPKLKPQPSPATETSS